MPLPFDRATEQCLRILHAPMVRAVDTVMILERLASYATQINQPEIVRDWPAAVARMNRDVDAFVTGVRGLRTGGRSRSTRYGLIEARC